MKQTGLMGHADDIVDTNAKVEIEREYTQWRLE